jgi:hypothetical protein
MRTRHKMPTIFSLSMLDVLCCGLGGMILLMLLNMWDARRQSTALALERGRFGEKSKELDETLAALTGANQELERTRGALSSTRGDLSQRQDQLRASEKERGQLQSTLRSRDEQAAALQEKLTLTEKDAATIRQQLVQALRTVQERQKMLLAKEEERATIQADLAIAAAEIERQQKLLAAALAQLNLTDKQRADAEKMAGQIPTLRADLAAAEKRAQAKETELADLRKRAEQAGLKMADAQKQEQAVLVEVNTLKKLLDEQKAASGRLRQQLTQAENRFAGVDLGGKNILILIDMSGSMASVDGQNLDPTKWPEVRRTVVQVLQSLSEAQQFQVILFSTQTQFLLGKPGEWLAFDKTKSPLEVERALAQITPRGDTNMFAAFDAAFQFRSRGLDTVYLFSDGLPNVGPGLPPDPPKEEGAREGLLGKHVREAIQKRWNIVVPRVQIHAVGFFYESPNLGAFLWALTRENGGSFVGMGKP